MSTPSLTKRDGDEEKEVQLQFHNCYAVKNWTNWFQAGFSTDVPTTSESDHSQHHEASYFVWQQQQV